jgi:hypothetical protein
LLTAAGSLAGGAPTEEIISSVSSRQTLRITRGADESTEIAYRSASLAALDPSKHTITGRAIVHGNRPGRPVCQGRDGLPEQECPTRRSACSTNTFVVSDPRGDLRPPCRLPPHGFFSEDTRFLSQRELTVSGRRTELLSVAQVNYFVAQFFLVPPTAAFHTASPLSLVRRRIVKDVWLEELVPGNHREEPLDVAIDLAVAADFADLFDAVNNVR